MLRNNFTPFGTTRFLSGGAVTTFGTAFLMRRNDVYENARIGQKASVPQGYTQAYRATIPALSAFNGRVSARLTNDSGFVGDVVGVGVLESTLDGDSSIAANGYMGKVATATLAANSTLAAQVVGKGKMSANINAGAQPSAFDIAQEVLGSVVEAGVDLRSVLKILAAVAAGKTSVTDLGGGGATVVFRDINDTRDTVTATMAGSERTNVVKDV